MQGTPGSKSQTPSWTTDLAEHAPTTPKLPFDPPRRRSSLAFSRIMETPQIDQEDDDSLPVTPCAQRQTPELRPNIGRKRTVETPSQHAEANIHRTSYLQRVFKIAQANLHRDMHFASLPAGSIDSRLPQHNSGELSKTHLDQQTQHIGNTWRYSTVPNISFALHSDVREPLPAVSPVLPTMALWRPVEDEIALEPPSSGFASPTTSPKENNEVDELKLSPSPGSDPSSFDPTPQKTSIRSAINCEDLDGDCSLTQPMTSLKVGNDIELQDGLSDEDMDDSPIIDHLRRKSAGNTNLSHMSLGCPDILFLSKSAKAAAESAKAKRDLLKRSCDHLGDEGSLMPNQPCLNPLVHSASRLNCPDPEIHHYLAATSCPDPLAHVRANAPEEFSTCRHRARLQAHSDDPIHVAHKSGPIDLNSRIPPFHRTTAAGSPMPFAKRTMHPANGFNDTQIYKSNMISDYASTVRKQTTTRSGSQATHHTQRPSEHFRPGWYYASESSSAPDQPAMNLYSFSTAAAKVTGESAAPDLQIRNSYRTDTLTPLARPPGRFRKTGIAATLQSSGLGRNHRLGALPPLPSNRRMPAYRARELNTTRHRNLQIHSSPPPSLVRFGHGNARKRANDDSGLSDFEIAEDDSAMSTRPSIRSQSTGEIIEMRTGTRAAVHTSLYGTLTPGFFQKSGEGMRELSPNVSIWRKGMQGRHHHRKKRRPSYWDGDLREVKMSPAGRGGIESSPAISKQSMVADLEMVSTRAGSMDLDEKDTSYDTNQSTLGDRDNLSNEVDMVDTTRTSGHYALSCDDSGPRDLAISST